MKLCLICGNKVHSALATCPKCGHASWQLLPETKPAPVTEPEPEERTTRNLRGKRGRR